jgi:hypothetical protein
VPAFPGARIVAKWECRLSDVLERRAGLVVCCELCGHTAPADPVALARIAPEGARALLLNLERRLRCRQCRRRVAGSASFRVRWPGAEQPDSTGS